MEDDLETPYTIIYLSIDLREQYVFECLNENGMLCSRWHCGRKRRESVNSDW
jgi:hypothetical protein